MSEEGIENIEKTPKFENVSSLLDVVLWWSISYEDFEDILYNNPSLKESLISEAMSNESLLRRLMFKDNFLVYLMDGITEKSPTFFLDRMDMFRWGWELARIQL